MGLGETKKVSCNVFFGSSTDALLCFPSIPFQCLQINSFCFDIIGKNIVANN
jgi:hypothetical protein